MVGDMLLPAHFFGGRGSICGCRTSFCVGRASSGAASALTFRDRCSMFVPFSPPVQSVATERREGVENERQTCFSSAKYSILEYQGSSFQLIDSAWPDIVGVLLACGWFLVEVRSSLLFVAFPDRHRGWGPK